MFQLQYYVTVEEAVEILTSGVGCELSRTGTLVRVTRTVEEAGVRAMAKQDTQYWLRGVGETLWHAYTGYQDRSGNWVTTQIDRVLGR